MQATAPEAVPWRVDLARATKTLVAGLWAGLISGFVIGGVGGRLAMFVLRLTSDPSLIGAETDDGFIIGSFTSDTGFLVLVCTALGGLGGVVYLLLRRFLPAGRRAGSTAVLTGVGGGAVIVHPGGIDFTVLEPLWLAIAMFVAIPAAYGAATSVLAERLLARASASSHTNWVLLLLAVVPVLATGTPGIAVVVVAGALWAAGRNPGLNRVFDPSRLALTGQILLGALAAWSLYVLIVDVRAIL